MNLTTKSEYELRALAYLRDKYDKGPVNISEISTQLNLSKTYIEQIFRKLKKANIIESYRGKEGGYKLKSDPSKINVGHVIRILEGNIELSHRCNDEKCLLQGCASRQVFSKIDNAVSNVIDHLTLDQI